MKTLSTANEIRAAVGLLMGIDFTNDEGSKVLVDVTTAITDFYHMHKDAVPTEATKTQLAETLVVTYHLERDATYRIGTMIFFLQLAALMDLLEIPTINTEKSLKALLSAEAQCRHVDRQFSELLEAVGITIPNPQPNQN